MNREIEVRKKGLLLATTEGNWNYYFYNNSVYSIAKNDDCEDCWFGGLDHIRRLYSRGIMKDIELTEKGKELIL